MSEIILALDQASQTTGYAIFENDQLITSGAFTVSGKLDTRLHKIRQQIQDFINQYKITYVILEDIQMEKNKGNNVVTYKALAEVIGVITELLVTLQIPYELVTASSWRSTLGIKGSQRAVYKKNTMDFIIAQHPGLTPTEDESDAIAIGEYYLQKNNLPSAF